MAKKSRSTRLKRHVKASLAGIATGAVSYALAWTLSLLYLKYWMRRHTQLASNMKAEDILGEKIWIAYIPGKNVPFWHTMIYVPKSVEKKIGKGLYDFAFFPHEGKQVFCFFKKIIDIEGIQNTERIYRLKKVKDPDKALDYLTNTIDKLKSSLQVQLLNSIEFKLCSNELTDSQQINFFKIIGLSKRLFGSGSKFSTFIETKMLSSLLITTIAWKAICEQVLPAEAVLYKKIAQFATLAGASGTVLGTLGYYQASKKAHYKKNKK
jgi:hypothetical protein